MYKVLVVDDEKIICDGMRTMFGMLGNPMIESVDTARSGMEALELIGYNTPDIVFADIRMEGMNGLEMVERMQKKSGNIKYIILSGYSDFQYAKQAIRLGVTDYLLKPVSIDELKTVVERSIGDLEQKKSISKQLELVESEKESLELESIFEKLMSSGSEAFSDSLNMRLSFFFPFRYFRVAVSFGASYEPFNAVKAVSHLVFNDGVVKHIVYGDDKIVTIFSFSNKSAAGPDEYAKKMNGVLRKKILHNMYTSCSETGDGIGKIPSLYEKALYLNACRLCDRNQYYINHTAENEIGDTSVYNLQIQQFRDNIKKLDMENACRMIDHILMSNMSNRSVSLLESLYNELVNIVVQGIEINDGSVSVQQPRNFFSFLFLNEICDYLKGIIHAKYDCIRSFNRDDAIVAKIKVFVMNNYQKDISMAMVSNLISMDYYYFSKFFKSHFKTTFSEYLRKKRMEEALKILIKEPSAKLKDIAEAVGYNDPRSFARSFENHFGFPVNLYRKGLIP